MELTQRFTMYDLFSMVFPGCFILWDLMSIDSINQYVGEPLYFKDHEILYYFAFFIMAYILGMVWNSILGELWRKFIKSFSESSIRRAVRNKKEEFFTYWNELKGDTNTERYKSAYGVVRKDNSTSSINSFESQISMLRNMAIPFAFWVGTVIYYTNNNICVCVIIGLLVALLIFSLALVRYIRLQKVVLSNFLRIKRSDSHVKSSNTISLLPHKDEVIIKILIAKNE